MKYEMYSIEVVKEEEGILLNQGGTQIILAPEQIEVLIVWLQTFLVRNDD